MSIRGRVPRAIECGSWDDSQAIAHLISFVVKRVMKWGRLPPDISEEDLQQDVRAFLMALFGHRCIWFIALITHDPEAIKYLERWLIKEVSRPIGSYRKRAYRRRVRGAVYDPFPLFNDRAVAARHTYDPGEVAVSMVDLKDRLRKNRFDGAIWVLSSVGYSTREIGELLGWSHTSVHNRLKKMNEDSPRKGYDGCDD